MRWMIVCPTNLLSVLECLRLFHLAPTPDLLGRYPFSRSSSIVLPPVPHHSQTT
ncbi:hypothetical protein C8R44DRAFT_303990 [Mycena epipterygia]|nr:hypothetical protein C8R44DRAFT_303990 [Mycena epipterygia]